MPTALCILATGAVREAGEPRQVWEGRLRNRSLTLCDQCSETSWRWCIVECARLRERYRGCSGLAIPGSQGDSLDLESLSIWPRVTLRMDFPGGSVMKNPPVLQEPQEMWVRSLGWEDPLEEVMATHSSILAWRIPWTKGSGSLQSIGLQTVRHDWSDLAHTRARVQTSQR